MKILKSKIILYIILELFILLIFTKAFYINTEFINHDSTFIYRFYQSIANDSIIYFLVLLITYISYQNFIYKSLGLILRIFSLIIFTIYIVDIFILIKFANHLVINDIFKYITYVPDYIEQQYNLNIIHLIVLSLVLFLSIYFISYNLKIKTKHTQIYFIFILSTLMFLYLTSDKGRYIHSWLFKNFISYNIESYNQSKNYTQDFINNLTYKEKLNCINSNYKSPNIIILMVESLASYQSRFFSSLKNWTPNLDKIAKNNLSFKTFFANGFVTEDAEISILTGEFPIYGPKAYSNSGGVSFEGFFNLKNALPFILKSKGYSTEFITSSDLEFSNTGNWAKSIGFQYIEGSEHPYYTNKNRYHFKAAADEYLYDRVLNRLDIQNNKSFLFVKTVSSHAPFINPENNSRSEEETIRYVDNQIGKFYKELEKRNFFENGLLIILGDHHPIVPIKKEEIEKFGELKSSSIVPMIVSYNKTQEIIDNQFQQVDIYNSIKNLVSDYSCTTKWSGDFLNQNYTSPNFIIHRRGDQRGIISVFENEKEYNVSLKGDMTNFINNSSSNQIIIDKINFLRINKSFYGQKIKQHSDN